MHISKITLLMVGFILSTNALMAQNSQKFGLNPGTLNASAVLEIESTSKGFLPPRMTIDQRNAISSPATGLMIYCTNAVGGAELQVYNSSLLAWASMNKPAYGVPTTPGKPIATLSTSGGVSLAFTSSISSGDYLGDITGYTVSSVPAGFTAVGTASPLVVLGLTSGTSYTFSVMASNAAGNSAASILSDAYVAVAAPSAPTSAVASMSNSQATVSFATPTSLNGSTITGYTVTSSPGSITASNTVSPVVVNGLTSGTSYTFTVVANSTAGNSIASVPTGTKSTFLASGSAICDGTRTTDIVEITSTTGQKWMDRNLGASQVALSEYDKNAYGCLYQWGRGNDGHASINWVNSNSGTAISTTTTTASSSDTPGNSNFITDTTRYDWRSATNNTLWQSTGTNNPCPAGFRVPTQAELSKEFTNTITNARTAWQSVLKLTVPGTRSPNDGSVNNIGVGTYYWTSSAILVSGIWLANDITLTGTGVNTGDYSSRAYGFPVRCIKG